MRKVNPFFAVGLRRNGRTNRGGVEAMEQRLLLSAHIVGSSTVYPTISAAVSAASAGATITVDAGTYAEQVTITKSLTITGAEAGIDARTRVGGSTAAESILHRSQ
jgi:pectin methylesterase-like acyl-CoA thioesterase